MELLIELYKISSPSKKEKDMIRFICQILATISVPYEVDKYGNIYATKGKSQTYPCLVAHTDEVHSKRKHSYEVVNFRDEIIFGYNTHKKHLMGIGADDKNGIWVCLKCLEEYDHMKCVFFMGEEIGCIGSNRANMTFFDDCRYVLQCDRKGNSDIITSVSGMELCSDDFLNDINISEFGYKIEDGLQTDVAILKNRGLDVSCVNISCGYYNPHENEEYTNIADLRKCHSFVRHIIDTCTETYKHIYKPIRYRRFDRHNRSFFYGDLRNNYGFEDDNSLYNPFERRRKSKSYNRDYLIMLDCLTKLLACDSELTIEAIVDIFSDRFPGLSYKDYENAYREVLG